MRYYSDKLNKLFENEDALFMAEREHDEEKAKEEETKKERSKNKKELSDKIEQCNSDIEEAQESLQKAKDLSKEIFSKAYDDSLALIKPATDNLKEAQQRKYEAIKEFNQKYGTYSVSYSGEKAYNELKRNIDWLDDLFTRLWW